MISIRPLRAEDVDPVLALLAASSDVAGDAAGWNRRAFEDILANPDRSSCLLAEQDSIVVGFACFRLAGGEAELLNLAVLPEARRQGGGSRLLKQVLLEVADRGAERIFLEVRDSNVAARRLYERFGFQLAGRRSGYYACPAADAVMLRRSLPSPAHAASHRLAESRKVPDPLTVVPR